MIAGKRWNKIAAAAMLLVLSSPRLLADLPEWVRRIERDSALQEVFFRPVTVPKGAVLARRSPRETRAALSALISNDDSDARLYALRAYEAERQLDFGAAEADWKTFAESSRIPVEGWRALANFYHRRLRPAAEVDALAALTRLPLPEGERLQPPQQQLAWKTFEEIFRLIEAHALPNELAVRQYSAWIEIYPTEQEVYSRFFERLLEEKQFPDAEQLLGRYRQQFPSDAVFPIKARAALIRQSQSADDMFAFYKEAFEPSWPLELIRHYFSALEEQILPQTIFERLRAAADETPNDFRAVAKVFYYYQRRGDLDAAKQVLAGFCDQKQAEGAAWNAGDLLAVAELFATVRDHARAGLYFYATYLSPSAAEGQKEQGLAGLLESLISALADSSAVAAGTDLFELSAALILDDPEFGDKAGSLLHRDSSSQPSPAADAGEQLSPRRESLGELLIQFDSEFPQSERRALLHWELLEKCGARLGAERIVSLGESFLASFENSPHRGPAALVLGDTYAAAGRSEDEWSLYTRLLQELAPEPGSVPLGGPYSQDVAEVDLAYSPGYARVLNRYVSRLTAAGMQDRILAVFQQQMERHPSDAGLFARFAVFLQQNRLDAELEQLYRRAIQKFQNADSYLALARWRQRQHNDAALQELSSEAIRQLSAADVETYLETLFERKLGPAISAQLYAQAFERFPFNLTFAHRLLDAYQQDSARDAAAWERVLRQYWFYDEQLRTRFVAYLLRAGRLKQESGETLAALPLASAGRWQQLVRENPAAARFVAETELAASHFESAVPLLLALANEFPADVPVAERASSALRTIALANPLYIYIVLGIEEGLHYSEPRDLNRLSHLGSIWADQQQFERAATYWEQMSQIEPGRAESYLEAAAAFSHYGLFDEALRMLHQGRAQFPGEGGLYAYETGAIYERKGDYVSAVAHYLQGVIVGRESSKCRERIVALARHAQHGDLVRQSIAQLTAGQNPEMAAVMLHVAVLDAEGNRPEIQRLLARVIDDTTSIGLLETLSHLATRSQMDRVALQARQRQITLAETPADRVRLQLSLLHRSLAARDYPTADAVRNQLYREHPKDFAAVRDAADSSWQAQQFDEAFSTLATAARGAYPQLAAQATFQAAQAAAAAGGYESSRLLLLSLLAEHPSSSEYLDAVTGSYAQQSAREGLLLFQQAYAAEIERDSLPEGEKTKRFVALERSTIAGLTRLGDYSGALDRHAELMERGPANASTVAEAVRYAERHGLTRQLADHYAENSADSRQHPIIAARLRDLLEDHVFPAPVSAGADSERLAALRPEELPPPPAVKPRREPQTAEIRRPATPAETALRPSAVENGIFCIQVAAYKELERATQLATELQQRGYPARADSSDGYDRVLVGDFKSWRDAAAMEQQLKNAGYETWLRYVPASENASVR